MQGATDPVMRPVGEETEAVLGRVDGKKPRFLFFENVIVAPRDQKMVAELGSLGQNLDDPLHLRGVYADLVRRAAAALALSAALAMVLQRQERFDIDLHSAVPVLRRLLLTTIFSTVRLHKRQGESRMEMTVTTDT